MDIETQQKTRQMPTILKLKKIFSLGYLPSRGDESYTLLHRDTNIEFSKIANCLAHSFFNLTNEQLEDFNLFDSGTFRWFYLDENDERALDRVLEFVEKTGLKVEETSLEQDLAPNQWKVAVYFRVRENKNVIPDFHFILQEKDGVWSSKEGAFPTIDYFQHPPEMFYSAYGSHFQYKLYGYLMVTNARALDDEFEMNN
ncbi:MAG: hypothetical protein E7379_02220 [Clostridiales bacterium]|nr:hypothetical protein [Clostridiales bacterium]